MKLVTWNVNSIKARLDRVLAFLERENPDVLCLQELKATDDAFPFDDIEAAGYSAAVHGQKTYNGVAILSREEASHVSRGIGDDHDDDQARLIAADITGVRVLCAYVPNGKTVGSDSYQYKIEWLQRLRRSLPQEFDNPPSMVLCGDMNIAPDDLDVANPEKWAPSVLCHEDVRKEFAAFQEWGLQDVFREKNPDGHVYSWWDYRMLAFPKGDGLRIDHILATGPVARTCVAARVDRNERKGKLPSDHAPVIAEFDL